MCFAKKVNLKNFANCQEMFAGLQPTKLYYVLVYYVIRNDNFALYYDILPYKYSYILSVIPLNIPVNFGILH